MPSAPASYHRALGRGLLFAAGSVAGAMGILTWKVFEPVAKSYGGATTETLELKLPAYDLAAWHAMPVQSGGRVMPLETAAINAVRQVTGRTRYAGRGPVDLFVSWWLTQGSSSASQLTDWENQPFILCDHHVLREAILRDSMKGEEPTSEQIHGKYLTPAQVRNSPSLLGWLREARTKRLQDPQKADQQMTPEERKAQELEQRLLIFDSITQGNPMVMTGRPHLKPNDPLHLTALDRVPGSPWFALGQMRQLLAEPAQWVDLMHERPKATPHLYLTAEHRQALERFQAHIKAGTEKEALDELRQILRQRLETQIADYRTRSADFKSPQEQIAFANANLLNTTAAQALFADRLRELAQRLETRGSAALPPGTNPADLVVEQVRSVLIESNDKLLADLAQQAVEARAQGYIPDKEEFRMLHMTYLEQRFPQLYLESAASQPFPAAEARTVLEAFEQLRAAYTTADPARFAAATAQFTKTLVETSQKFDEDYPGCDTLELELLLNRIEPFKWAWVAMAVASLFLAISLGTTSRVPYALGFLFFFVSLGFQLFGFYARIDISKRAPVTNMYETVVFVAAMAAVFAFLLEAIYRRKYIALAGSLVATLGLVLADQLPVTRGWDPSIAPLEPVLRSNYWLIVHVMTIVASYAAGALAWGLGNLILVMYLVRTPSAEQVKGLALFTYRAMQIAVLLLAAGTFLGGWWAAESWGRFWGWDPKETWALIALIAYAIPLHARYLGWVKAFGLAVSAVVCFASIVMSWYGVNFILGAGLHSYGFGGGGPWGGFWACLINLEFVLVVALRKLRRDELALEAE